MYCCAEQNRLKERASNARTVERPRPSSGTKCFIGTTNSERLCDGINSKVRKDVVIAKVISLQKDGTEQPQFYELAVKYDGVGAPGRTVVYGTEENLRELLRDGGIAGIDIDALFKSVVRTS
jgi:hypothetical protein